MMKSYSRFFVYILLALLPVKALATANMLVCNSMMQSGKVKQKVQQIVNDMPCHQEMENVDAEHSDHSSSAQQSTCASMCANLCALTGVYLNTQPTFATVEVKAINFNYLKYTSVTLPSLQRPPITFI